MLLGIDISLWQDDNSTPQKVDFNKAKAAGANFAFIKASERYAIDPDFVDNWKNAKKAGMPRGAYHFLRWDVSGLYQAQFFSSLLEDDIGELPPVADFEAPPKDGKYPSNALLFQFLQEVEKELGVRPIIYTSPGFWNSYGRDKNTGKFDDKWLMYDLWIAHYGVTQPIVPKPWMGWTFWQFSSNGDGLKFGAESKSIDLDYFNGGIDEFNHYISKEQEIPTDKTLEERVTSLEEWAKTLGYKKV